MRFSFIISKCGRAGLSNALNSIFFSWACCFRSNWDILIDIMNIVGVHRVQAMKSSFSTGHSFNAPTSSFLVYRENGFNFQKTSLTGDIHKSQIEDAVLHRPHSDQINLSMTDPVLMYDSRYRACHFTAKNCVPQSASQVYLQGLREYIAGMGGSLGDGWHVEFKYCDKRCKTYAVYVGPDGSPFELLDDVARHLGLDHSMEVENGGNGFTFVHEGLSNIPRSKEASGSAKARKSGQSRSSPGSSFFRNGGSIFKCIYPSVCSSYYLFGLYCPSSFCNSNLLIAGRIS